MNTGTIPSMILSKVLSRYIGLPAAIAMTLFSAHKAHKAYRKLKVLEAELINPFKVEAGKWSDAISQLGGAREELTYSQKKHFPDFITHNADHDTDYFHKKFAPSYRGSLIERHSPDPEKAHDLICRAKRSISRCSDDEKEYEKCDTERILSEIEEEVYKLSFKREPDYGLSRIKLKDLIDRIKWIRSGYYYRISQNQKRIDIKFQRWLLSAGISLASAGVFGAKGLKK